MERTVDQETRKICIEGWRGISHSFAVVNQNQLVEMSRMRQLKLFHREAPLLQPHWKRTKNGGGFSDEESALINRIPPPDGRAMDVTLRILARCPTTPSDSAKTVTFLVVSVGAPDLLFDGDPGDLTQYTEGENLVVTPTTWARDRLVEFGFDGNGIRVVPHGVKTEVFMPLDPTSREQNRSALGVRPHETVFLNVGGTFWNKGQDVLLVAFAVLRQRGHPVRLFLKDSRHLYGGAGEDLVASVSRAFPGLVDSSVLAAISTIPDECDMQQLRVLYGISDAYVSPYRAEGFNLPVLEAMACGRPVIVSAGGATDDFCPTALARKVSTKLVLDRDKPKLPNRFLEPNLESLVAEMERVIREHGEPYSDVLSDEVKSLRTRFSWKAVTEELVKHL